MKLRVQSVKIVLLCRKINMKLNNINQGTIFIIIIIKANILIQWIKHNMSQHVANSNLMKYHFFHDENL